MYTVERWAMGTAGVRKSSVMLKKRLAMPVAVVLVWLISLVAISAPWASRHAVAAEPIRLTKGPYIQNATVDSALVCWEANVPHSGAVAYGTTTAYGSLSLADGRDRGHCARLDGLQAYTVYHYKVLAEETELSSDATFKTLAGPKSAKISFVAWGDNRTNHSIHRGLALQVKQAEPDFVINVGDLVESGKRMSDWDAFFEDEKELLLTAPLYPALGNQEEDSPLYFSLFALPGNERWYSFDSGPAHFVALDVVFSDYGPGSEQYAWLERDLRETARPWKIVFAHYPPYDFSSFRGSALAVREALAPLFEKYGVQVVFGGHNHHYQRNLANGVTYIVTGGGGAPLHPVAIGPWTAYAETTYHFVKISIDGNTLSSVAVRADGSEFDPFTLSLKIAPFAPEEPVINSLAPVGILEMVSCQRCHDPFRLTNKRLVSYGWKFHRPFIVRGGIALAALVLLLVGGWWAWHLKIGKGKTDHAKGKTYSQSHTLGSARLEQPARDSKPAGRRRHTG
ncbi:MAG: metallophosphoesterase family protein [Chloroflexi bacterium]|nr:metallophosphoesterase family protein [Chloroflexota bacterium]